MDNIIKSELLEEDGKQYRVDYSYDNTIGAPWEEYDGHGVVSEWTTREKRPSERVLASEGRTRRYYDVALSQMRAISDGWVAAPYDVGTPRQRAARAVEADYRRLKAWCNDKWYWMEVIITEIRIDYDGIVYDGPSTSMGGVESDSEGEYIDGVINDLIGQMN
jgi:hypothetical protein